MHVVILQDVSTTHLAAYLQGQAGSPFHHDVIACLCSGSYAMSSSPFVACRFYKDLRSISRGQEVLVALQPFLLSSRHPNAEATISQKDAIQRTLPKASS